MKKANHIKDLVPDQRNPRKRTQKNLGMIADSLQAVGAARSIVIDEDNNILAGNGTIEAAAQVGIEKVKVVEADGETIVAVRRTGLSEKQKLELKLRDNRTAETAVWDADVLQEIERQAEIDLAGIWEDDAQLNHLLTRGLADEEDPGEEEVGFKVEYTLIFEDEKQQERWHQFLRHLKREWPDKSTHAARIAAHVEATLSE